LAVLALSVWITDKSVALGYAVGTHGVNMLVNTVIGSLCLAREGINLRSLGALPKGAQESILLPRKGGD